MIAKRQNLDVKIVPGLTTKPTGRAEEEKTVDPPLHSPRKAAKAKTVGLLPYPSHGLKKIINVPRPNDSFEWASAKSYF